VTKLTDEQAALFTGANYGVVTTLREDGSPQSTVVWVDLEGDGTPSFNTAKGRVKPSNLERDSRVSVLVVEGGDFYQWVSIDGRVELTDDGAHEQIDRLSHKYDGKPWQYVDGQERVKARILPDRVIAYGLT
jgi:PPOX class probable F420-dependent enzyme